LRPPLPGFATFDGTAPHRLVALDVRAGVQTVRRVGAGSTAAQVRRAYPEARLVTTAQTDPFDITAYVVRRGGRDRMWLLLNRPGGRVTVLDVPAPQFCD